MSAGEAINLPWLAGFFDGEGCVLIGKFWSKRDKRYQFDLRVSLHQKNATRILEEIKNEFGGTITVSKRDPGNETLRMQNKVAKRFLEAIAPYVKIKKDQVDLALIFQHNKGKTSFEKDEQMKGVLSQMKRMKV